MHEEEKMNCLDFEVKRSQLHQMWLNRHRGNVDDYGFRGPYHGQLFQWRQTGRRFAVEDRLVCALTCLFTGYRVVYW